MKDLLLHQQRVVDEKNKLDEKLIKLKAFFGKDVFKSISEDEQGRLQRQAEYMTLYFNVLAERISNF